MMPYRTRCPAVPRVRTPLSAKLAACLILPMLLMSGCQTPAERNAREAAVARAIKGKALFQEKCRTLAGRKIYRRVPDVEGIVLLKIRPAAGDREWSDQMWPGAAFAREATGDEYITTFLGYEHSASSSGAPVSATNRGYIGTDYQSNNPSNVPGYKFVDVDEGGRLYRYSGSVRDVVITSSILAGGDGKRHLVKRYVLDRVPAPDSSVRYAVTFEDHIVAEERALGIASSTIKVLDLQTKEVLGELTRFAWSPGGPSRNNPSPWLTAYRCPDQAVGTGAATRKFVDQIVIPRRKR